MLVSYNWIKEFVEIEESAERVAEILTMGGIEVESVVRTGAGLQTVLTARVDKITAHPKSEKLSIVTVSLGNRLEEVVCGAPNVKDGQVIAYAVPGTVTDSGLTIGEREILGVKSPGMICSEKELGLGDDASGILVLDDGLPLGVSLSAAMPFVEDFILETSVTPNRGDCLSVLGIAREIAALTSKPWRIPEFKLEEGPELLSDRATIEIVDVELCPRYVVRMVQGVKPGPSPFQERLKLTRAGLRPISNIVDATNLILLECGQPLHAFDFDLLQGGKIVVRKSDPQERFVTLDGSERILPVDSLMIRDAQRPVAIAGIMGGANSEINYNTSCVLIESACFERFGIRRTAKSLNMSTEASYRFERGIDPEATLWAAHRAAYIIQKLAGGSVLKGFMDSYPNPIVRNTIRLSCSKTNDLLGTKLHPERINRRLTCLGIEVSEIEAGHETMSCVPPSWRWDLDREVDLIEEVARIEGFQNIPISMPKYVANPDRSTQHHRLTGKTAELMNASGFTEIITMSFVSSGICADFGWVSEEHEELKLLNPLTEEHAVMRTSLLPGLFSAAKRNINYRNEDIKLYEIGKTFVPDKDSNLPREDLKLAAIAYGKRYSDLWHFQRGEADEAGRMDLERQVDFYDMKGALENVLESLGITDSIFSPSKASFLHPGKSAEVILDGKVVGILGEVSPKKIRELDVSGNFQILEILLEPLFVRACKERVFRQIPRYPYIERDLSLIVKTNCSGDKIKHLISRLGRGIIVSVKLFDLYRGESIPAGSQSMAFRIRYQSEDKTLTDEEVQEVHRKVTESLVSDLGATLRD
jgi:phenylalanyl-tRNA synthetase beta chain